MTTTKFKYTKHYPYNSFQAVWLTMWHVFTRSSIAKKHGVTVDQLVAEYDANIRDRTLKKYSRSTFQRVLSEYKSFATWEWREVRGDHTSCGRPRKCRRYKLTSMEALESLLEQQGLIERDASKSVPEIDELCRDVAQIESQLNALRAKLLKLS